MTTDSVEEALQILNDLSTSWGSSSIETRKLATWRTRCEGEARAFEEIAQALETSNKTPEQLASSISFLSKVTPSFQPKELLKCFEKEISKIRLELINGLREENALVSFTNSSILEKCNCGEQAEDLFEQERVWKSTSVTEWCSQARKERLFATKSMPNSSRASGAFEKAAIASIKLFLDNFYSLQEDSRRRASKVKLLKDALPELKDSCGSSNGAKLMWETKFNEIKHQTNLDAEKVASEHPIIRWSSNFHGVDPCCLEVFGLLIRAGTASETPRTIITTLLDRLRDSSRGGENDLFVLLGCCNTLDYVLSYLDEFTPERSRAISMFRTSKDGFVKRACVELEKNGEHFVKQSARFFQVQNPVLRTELRLEVSKAWKSSFSTKRSTSDRDLSSMDDSFSNKDTNIEVGGVVALFFEGPNVHNT